MPTLQVSEQMDSLRVLFTDPVDYLVTPRVLASMVAGPILNVLCFCMGERLPAACGCMLTTLLYVDHLLYVQGCSPPAVCSLSSVDCSFSTACQPGQCECHSA